MPPPAEDNFGPEEFAALSGVSRETLPTTPDRPPVPAPLQPPPSPEADEDAAEEADDPLPAGPGVEPVHPDRRLLKVRDRLPVIRNGQYRPVGLDVGGHHDVAIDGAQAHVARSGAGHRPHGQ